MEEEEKLIVMQEDEQELPRPTQIFVEQKEEESTSAQGSAGKKDKHTESPPISTELKILVDACIQTEDPSVSDACMETTSFQELRGTWWKEYEQSRAEAFQQ